MNWIYYYIVCTLFCVGALCALYKERGELTLSDIIIWIAVCYCPILNLLTFITIFIASLMQKSDTIVIIKRKDNQ